MVYFRIYLRYEWKQPVSISSFPFPTYYPDTGTGSEYLNRTFVSSFTQPSARQGLQCLTLFQIGEGYRHP